MNTNTYDEKTDDDTKNSNRSYYLMLIDRYPDRLKYAIDESGLSNSAIARRAGVSEAVIRKYLRCEALPTLDRAVGLAEACNKPLEWFISDKSHLTMGGWVDNEQINSHERDDEATKPADVLALSYETRMQEIVSVLSRISDKHRDDILNIIYLNGISTILSLEDESNLKFIQLPKEDKEKLLRLHSQIKEGASEGNQEDAVAHPTQNQVG